jgi:hypothetical protein
MILSEDDIQRAGDHLPEDFAFPKWQYSVICNLAWSQDFHQINSFHATSDILWQVQSKSMKAGRYLFFLTICGRKNRKYLGPWWINGHLNANTMTMCSSIFVTLLMNKMEVSEDWH